MYVTKKTYSWYALHTYPRAEKKVLKNLQDLDIEAFLPLQKKLKQWSDRKKWVEEPLIRSYIFVRISQKEYLSVFKVPQIVRIVSFLGEAAVIPDQQIENLRLLLTAPVDIEPTEETINPGDPVEVCSGPLLGLQGELIEFKGRKKVLVRIDHIGFSLLVEFPIETLKHL